MIPIIVVAYNRPRSLARILKSLKKADYNNEKVELIISIDKGNNQEVLNIANDFDWEFGEKIVIYQDINLGLRKHILKCASLSQKYGSVIVLEDDLYVSSGFYNYTKQALEFSKDKDYIAGISLYNHKRNVIAMEPFESIQDGYDNYYFKFASSWGQAWTKEQWILFQKWYNENKDLPLENDNIPKLISNWPKTSWLKYFMKYLIDSNRFFIYPKVSLTTNFSDKGTHVGNDNTDYQVSIEFDNTREYRFSTLKQSKAKYDIFFENMYLNNILSIEEKDLCVDLYGLKKCTKEKYYLTRKRLNKKIIKTFACSLRPHELNIIENIDGDDFILYDMSIFENNSTKFDIRNKKFIEQRKIDYYLKTIPTDRKIELTKMHMKQLLKQIIKKILKLRM